MNQVIEDFCCYYQELTLESLESLGSIYSQNAVFDDPVHSIKGIENIKSYFTKTIVNVNYCRFKIDTRVETDTEAFITWVMIFSHPKLNNGLEIELPGTSHLKFDDTIFYQRDYYDLGHMIYEQIPILKNVIGMIKSRLTL
ncbi:MAG: hypothetical protein ACI93R_000229 [Flavobacteriales bacterium]|jgi:hypothetical protein